MLSDFLQRNICFVASCNMNANQCFSTFLLKGNLPQMCALLTEPYAMIQGSKL